MAEHLKFSPNILKHLGEELVPHLDQSIIEIIKNSYDADATECTVELQNTDIFGGSIIIKDNGTGMTEEDIKNGWLLIGKSRKAKNELTPIYKRIPVGDKGLGRLSALRLGTKVKLTSVSTKNPSLEYTLEIDWDKYDKANAVEDVGLTIKKTSTTKKPGTEIVISNLRKTILRKEVDSLAKSILLLTGPFEFKNSFKAKLLAPEFRELEAKVTNAYFNDATYKLTATNDSNGNAEFIVYDWRGQKLWSQKADQTYDTVPLKFEFWAFILDGATFSTRASTKSEVADWLKECGGVHLFEGGMRVAPYGDAGVDWLDLNLARARSPEERPSTNNSIGRIVIDNTTKSLAQKTDRYGYIETAEFHNLKKLAQDALEFLARRRLASAEERREKNRKELLKKETESDLKLDKALNKALPKINKPEKEKVKKVIEEVVKAKEKETIALREDLQLYRSLATAGMTSAVFAHEIGKPLGNIERFLKDLSNPADLVKADILEDTIRLTHKAIKKLRKYIELPLNLINVMHYHD